ncbi:MAG TPA: type 2 isopentenyl-diphosphate Delta-isomerase [Candidatus Binatia bacterium]|nr:type 2 isopentenyl-diphosphate Delta-isomerase [Candidatus Binatia bacterium]
MAESISDRKRSHLELCEAEGVEYAGKTTLLEDVDLVHDALPELAVDQVDVGATLLGKRLRAPLLITGMTGGTEEASAINRALAQVAEEHGIAFGLGSQRAMHRAPALAYTFEVRAHAPTTLVLANLGIVQATALPTAEIERLVRAVGADALCLHLNPAQELIQPGGDRDFRGGVDTIRRLVGELPLPVVVKETGCGISRPVGERLAAAGVRTVDVSGAGGTSWVKVEALRAGAAERELGTLFADWGIPTAASLLAVRGLGFDVVASGGIRTGLDVAKAIALGARVAGVALPVFRAFRQGGHAAAGEFITRLVAGLRTAMVLTGAQDVERLGRVPVVLGSRLREWDKAEGGA